MAIRCRRCNGMGTIKCSECNGKGETKAYREINPEAWWWETCDKCDGKGEVSCPNECDHGWIR